MIFINPTYLDAIGYLLVAGILLGAPLPLVVYGIYIYNKHGLVSQGQGPEQNSQATQAPPSDRKAG